MKAAASVLGFLGAGTMEHHGLSISPTFFSLGKLMDSR